MAELQNRWIDAAACDMPPRFGDLVVDERNHFGIIIEATPDRLTVFVDSGAAVVCRPTDVKQVMMPGGLSGCNFQEVLATLAELRRRFGADIQGA
jgi:hypothetical protein